MKRDKREQMLCELGAAVMRDHGGSETDSPIEDMLLAALLYHRQEGDELEALFADRPGGSLDDLERLRAAGIEPCASNGWWGGWFLFVQDSIGQYRVDFSIVSLGMGRLVIECDGHDFHEKTKEQAARDKRRDRFLQQSGYRVLRFTGSEIYRDAHACVQEVRDTLDSMTDEAHAAWLAAQPKPAEPMQ